MSTPLDDQIEINVFGPGFGEASAVHIGAGQWIIIDSCIDINTRQPAVLQYLSKIGVDVEKSVSLIIATHWHDDHIRGMASTLDACKSASFCSSAALGTKEFLQTIEAYNNRRGYVVSSGLSEIERVREILCKRRPSAPISALGVRKVLERNADFSTHNFPCEIITLSPSDAQFDQSIINIAKLMPLAFSRKIRAPSPSPNDLSIVAWVSVGPVAMLFGADLEEQGKPELGWSAVLSAVGRPQGRARFFKIPHHGSSNGHHDDVWNQMLHPQPYAVLTPWTLNKGLPSKSDVDRIKRYTGVGYATSSGQLGRVKKRSPAVEKTLRNNGISLTSIESKIGHIRIRNNGEKDFDSWSIELSDNACRLDELTA